jgi:hypothetical protein
MLSTANLYSEIARILLNSGQINFVSRMENGLLMQIPQIKAGMRLDVIFENELMKNSAHYMKAVIYDFSDDFVIISQTSPALNSHFLNRRLLLTFLMKTENRLLRLGFPGKLLEIISDYEIASGNRLEALRVKKYADPEPVDFRMYFRVKPSSQSDLCLFLQNEKVSLLDISIGGAKFSYAKGHAFQPSDKVNFRLLIGNSVFHLEGQVRHVEGPLPGATNKNIQYVSVEFQYEDKKAEAVLGRAIIDIERELLTEGKM